MTIVRRLRATQPQRPSPFLTVRFNSFGASTPEAYAHCLDKWHLADPLPVQYAAYLVGVVGHFDLGPSYTHASRTVNDVMGQFLPFSLILGLSALARSFRCSASR